MNYHKALQILDLPDPPTPHQVKKQFRVLALQYHPDRNPNDLKAVDMFRQCTEAYNYLLEHVVQWASVVTQTSPAANSQALVEDLEDIFDDIFGFSREGRILGVQHPQPLRLTLVEMAFGVTKKVKLESYGKCASCKGSGSAKGRHAPICTYCFGAGQIQAVISGENIERTCPKCEGRGRKVIELCKVCGGFGRTKKKDWQLVTIPQGLKVGGDYTLHSTDIKSEKAHEIFITPQVILPPFFTIESSDIVCEYPLEEGSVRIGMRIDVPTLWGWHEVKVGALFDERQVIVLKGFGFFHDSTKKNRGDLKLKWSVMSKKKTQRRLQEIRQVFTEDNPVYGSPKKGFVKWLLGI